MLELLKITHFLCLFAGGAGLVGNGILLRKVMASGAPPDPVLAASMGLISKFGLGAILTLWITGIAMVVVGDLAINVEFFFKMIAAAAVLILVVSMSAATTSAQKSGEAIDLDVIKRLSTAASIAALIAVVLAVLAFN